MAWLDFDLSVFDDISEMTDDEIEDTFNELGQYLAEYEWEVLDDLQIFMDSAGYGSFVQMCFVDGSGEDRFEEFSIPADDYEWDTYQMACKSNSANDYKRLYKRYISKKAGLL